MVGRLAAQTTSRVRTSPRAERFYNFPRPLRSSRGCGALTRVTYFTQCKLFPSSIRFAMRLLTRSFALFAVLTLAVPLRAASAHPRLLKSTPVADSRTPAAPRQVTLTFNESLDIALTRVTLHHGEMTLRLDSLRLVADDDKSVTATIIGSLAPGRYTVRWQVTGDDGHPVRGTFSFEVVAPEQTAWRSEGR